MRHNPIASVARVLLVVLLACTAVSPAASAITPASSDSAPQAVFSPYSIWNWLLSLVAADEDEARGHIIPGAQGGDGATAPDGSAGTGGAGQPQQPLPSGDPTE